MTEMEKQKEDMYKAQMIANIKPSDLAALKEKDAEEQQAQVQLKNLESNDATQALAALQTAQEVEAVYENMRGSGEDPKEE